MVVLKKIRASTLMETLVATVLIVIVFMLASMILNNLFSNTIKNNSNDVNAHLNELQYLYQNDKLILPYNDTYKNWTISIIDHKSENLVSFQAVNNNILKSLDRELKNDY